ncbi:MAG: hypothetical protein MI746_14410, partial [Pseudomonadales bacterium]|nr:hypothetical protein [Pseudomonadales bacterium]
MKARMTATVSSSLLLLVALLVLPALADEKPLALTGYDPVLLIEGTLEMGKPEFVSSDERYQYQFASQDSMNRFNNDKDSFGIQNEMCPVAPPAAADPEFFTVHNGKIYIFATAWCID